MSEYLSPDEIVDAVFSRMGKDDKKAVLEDAPTADHMLRYHHSVGRAIRNEFKLWDVNNPHTGLDDPMSHHFPDQVSHAILIKVWEKVQEESSADA